MADTIRILQHAGWGGRPRPLPTPWSAFSLLKKSAFSPTYLGMALWHRTPAIAAEPYLPGRKQEAHG